MYSESFWAEKLNLCAFTFLLRNNGIVFVYLLREIITFAKRYYIIII